jgi:NADH-quinone oxidoreductase subunit M
MATMVDMIGALALLGAPLTQPGQLPWLTLVTFSPLIGVLALLLMPGKQESALRTVALSSTLLTFMVSLGVMAFFDAGVPAAPGPFTFQMVEGPVPWIPTLGIHYAMGVDGLSLWLIMLTTFLMPLVILSTYSAVNDHVKEYMICLLVLQTAMLGALVSLDVFLFYIFWEMMLIPMYFIIGIWGGEDRITAAVKFFVYTLVGSLLMLIAILYVYFKAGGDGSYSFLFSDLLAVELSYAEQFWLFMAFFLAFAIKVPLFPFHTWLPLAHVQAPTAGSVVLAGVMLKMGTYGLVRYAFPMFPYALKTFAPYIALLAVIGILYGAVVAMVQPDVKKIVAYSSVSHLGFCVLGLVAMTPQALAGGVYIMLAHGIATGGLFLCVGILYERRHTKKIKDFGGVAKSMPVFSFLFMVIVMASVGLPGLNGFVGEFLVLIGSSKSNFLFFETPYAAQVITDPETGIRAWSWAEAQRFPLPDRAQAGPEITAILLTAFATLGVIFAAGYLLWMWRRVMFGPLTKDENKNLEDVNARELAYLVPIVLMAIFMGVAPDFFLSRMEPTNNQFLSYMAEKGIGGADAVDADATYVKDCVVVEDRAGDTPPPGPMVGGDASSAAPAR